MPRSPLVLLKLSGQVLGGDRGWGLSDQAVGHFVDGVACLRDAGLGVGLVIGGGNIFRGVEGAGRGVDRVDGDYMGMLATIINGLALKDGFSRRGVKAELFTPFDLPAFSTRFRASSARNAVGSGLIAIFAGGTGCPFFSTDSAAALRAAELGASLLAKGTKVDGVYDKDPMKDRSARRYDRLTYQEVLERNLGVMDSAAVALCRDAGIPVFVFDAHNLENFRALARGAWETGSLVGDEPLGFDAQNNSC